MMSDRPNYRDEIAEEIIARIEAGTAPWQKPWQAGAIGSAPFNPVSGKNYHGINDMWLTLQGRSDPRWMTYKQAGELEAQVRKGEKSTTIEYWQWTDRRPMTDAEGKPVLDGDGKTQYQTVRLDRPKVFYAKVFNAEQIDGLAPFVPPPAPELPRRIEQAEAMIASAGVPVHHDQGDRAYYSPARDEIHLPPMASFHNSQSYYETALHELGHATGHASRLNRSFGPFGSEGYAREELRAEISSYMVARDLGISFDPSNHAAYAASWLKALKEDRNEIFHAAKDAEIIKTWVMEPERRPELERTAQQREVPAPAPLLPNSVSPDRGEAVSETMYMKAENNVEEARRNRTYIAVPFAEKDEAKAAGAKWDRGAKSWYVPENIDPALFQQWTARPAPGSELKPEDEFGQALKANGLIVKDAPVMDGKWHRSAVDGDKGLEQNGSYRAFLDGRPSGNIQNFKAGTTVKWVATGVGLDDAEKARIQAEAANVREARAAAQQEAAQKTAKVAYGVWTNLPAEASPENSPYLAIKGVKGHGVKVNGEGQLVIPCRDETGRLWNVQFVGADGKRFLKDSRKAGTMHVVERSGKGTLDTLGQDRHAPIIIAEGYATAARIHEATGRPVVSAFDSGNLKAVAEAIHAKFPERPILIAADNDHSNKMGNVGMRKAEEAAKAVGGSFVAPTFSKDQMARKLTDFDDLGRDMGNGKVKQVIESALSKTRELERGIA